MGDELKIRLEPSEKFLEASKRNSLDLPWSAEDIQLDYSKIYITEGTKERFNEIISNSPNKAILFSGVPGTGKTTIAKQLIKNLLGEDIKGRYFPISFNESTSYTDFIEGVTMGDSGWEFRNGRLIDACIAAYNQPDHQPVFILIDEITRAKADVVFGEALSAMTFRNQVVLTKGGRELLIPDNLVIIATMNSLDRGAQPLSEALKERFHTIDIEPQWTREYLRTFSNTTNELLLTLLKIINNFNIEIRKLNKLKEYQIGTRFLNDMLNEHAQEITDEDVKNLADRIYKTAKARFGTGLKHEYIKKLGDVAEIAYGKD